MLRKSKGFTVIEFTVSLAILLGAMLFFVKVQGQAQGLTGMLRANHSADYFTKRVRIAFSNYINCKNNINQTGVTYSKDFGDFIYTDAPGSVVESDNFKFFRKVTIAGVDEDIEIGRVGDEIGSLILNKVIFRKINESKVKVELVLSRDRLSFGPKEIRRSFPLFLSFDHSANLLWYCTSNQKGADLPIQIHTLVGEVNCSSGYINGLQNDDGGTSLSVIKENCASPPPPPTNSDTTGSDAYCPDVIGGLKVKCCGSGQDDVEYPPAPMASFKCDSTQYICCHNSTQYLRCSDGSEPFESSMFNGVNQGVSCGTI